ncbi:sensor histidine kinase [Ruminococcus sp. AF41-9]|nr:sensor histidine kinase [Ruminococcus sp. AF41-9]
MRKKLKFIGTDTVIAAIFILALLNFSYVQNNKNSISRILNMKFQIVSDQNGNKQEEIPKEQERISGARSEKATVTEQKEDSYVKKSYLVAKAENGTLYVKNMLPDTEFSEEEIIETAEKFLETKKTSGSYENYQFEISVHKGELLIAFADIASLKIEEQKYFIFSLLAAFVLGVLWIYLAWKITGKIIAPLEEADRLQKEFVLFAGHELKTPVTVMKASLDMLEREGIHSKYLDYAAEENEKMRKLVIELLDYSKMEYQEEKSFRESVNFSQCIEGISLEFEAMAFEKEVILITDIKQNLAIAQSIAAKHHTEITVISENGWNCFITSFPL